MKNEIEFKFGDYAIIEQKRHGVPNEMFVHKVVGQLRSNTWVDVPVSVPATETLHGEMEDICLCICCGIDETEVRRYRVKDMRRHSPVSLVADEKRGSTITLQAVNELIASLESAGELSIREQKFLKMAKTFKQLAAENVALKAGVTYFAYSPEYGFDYFKDKQSAIDTAQAEIDAYREDADDGWSEDVQRVSWGVVIQQAQGFDAQGLHTSDSQHTYQTCNYRLVDSVETPATDRIVAGIKADGVEEWVSNRGGRWNGTTEEALKFAQQLREGADK
ncbi:hypothetical protein L4L50_11235 [Klebsiella pneumoniae]|nr:hypothetical protein [Klebsiella pneumoniae]MCF6857026.1 hypothetical protein [Klebsiella pneumoniae]MDR4741850.1 hypothetical protein [Klebsiella pneumoniae]